MMILRILLRAAGGVAIFFGAWTVVLFVPVAWHGVFSDSYANHPEIFTIYRQGILFAAIAIGFGICAIATGGAMIYRARRPRRPR